MERAFDTVGLALVAAAIGTFVSIVRDVSSHLPAEHRAALQGGVTFGQLRGRDRALGKAWALHGELFPQSRKRQVFAALVIAAALSVFAYPLWFALN